jgi:hypothetical protein
MSERWRVRYGRRAVLAGAAAAGAGAMASLAAGTGVAQAASNPVELGETNSTSGTTEVISSSATGLQGQTSTQGASGVAGLDTAGISGSHGVYGRSLNGTGVYGKLGTGAVPPAVSESAGVAGYDATGDVNIGVYGYSGTGYGVYAYSDSGIALQVDGPAEFSAGGSVYLSGQLHYAGAGVATVPKGKKTVIVKDVGLVFTDSMVLATIQQAQSGVYIEAAQPGTGKITITLSQAAKSDLPVAWFVVQPT